MHPFAAVEHSYNCMVLLCRALFGVSGRYTKISWNISTDVITSSGTIPGIIQAKEVIIYPKHSVPIFFIRQSLNDTVPQHQNGCFILYSTGQRWGSASYDLDWNTGTLTVNTPYASNDWNSVESNKIVKIAYR